MNLRILGIVVLIGAVLAGLYGVFRYGRYVENLEMTNSNNKEVIEEQAKNLKSMEQYADLITKAGEQHDKNVKTLGALTLQLGKLSRVPIHFPICPQSATPENIQGADGGSGVLSERVDTAFADLQERTGILLQRCDQMNVDVIRQNAEIEARETSF